MPITDNFEQSQHSAKNKSTVLHAGNNEYIIQNNDYFSTISKSIANEIKATHGEEYLSSAEIEKLITKTNPSTSSTSLQIGKTKIVIPKLILNESGHIVDGKGNIVKKGVINTDKENSAVNDSIAFIKDFEKFSPFIYPCPGGDKTIGYGHKIQTGEQYNNMLDVTDHLEININKILNDKTYRENMMKKKA